MIYNKGVATIPGAASGPSLVSPAAMVMLMPQEGFGQRGAGGVPCSPSARSGSERQGFAQSCCVEAVGRGFPLADPPLELAVHPRGTQTPVLVTLVWDFKGGIV